MSVWDKLRTAKETREMQRQVRYQAWAQQYYTRELAETAARVVPSIEDLTGIEVSQITPKSRFGYDLPADSPDLYEICLDLEHALKITITEKEAAPIKTVDDMIFLAHRKLGEL